MDLPEFKEYLSQNGTRMSHGTPVRWMGAVVLLVASAVLLGWGLDIAVLRSILPGLVAMNPTTALAFALAAGSLLVLSAQPSHSRRAHGWAAKVAAAAVAGVGVVTLTGYLIGRNIGLDQLLFGERLEGNRVAPNTGVNFVLVGVALLLLNVETRRGLRPSQLLAALSGLIALVSTIGYLYGVNELYGVAAYIPMALITALAFLALDTGLFLARPSLGLVALVTGPGPGASATRRLLPAAIAVPIAMGWLRLMGQRAGLYGTELGLTLFVLAVALIFATSILAFAVGLERTETERRRGEGARARLAAIVESSDDAIIAKALDGTITSWNPGAERLYGYPAAQVIGRPIAMLVPPERIDEVPDLLAQVASGRPVEHFETTRLTKDGRCIDVSLSISPIADGSGRVVGASSIARDVTVRKRAEELLAGAQRQLEQHTQALEAKTREQEAFVHTVSHDLRAPLVSLQGMASILLEDHARDLPNEAQTYLNRIMANADKMQALISDLLDLSRVGRVEFEMTLVDLDVVIADVTEQLSHTLAARGATVCVEGRLPTVWANSARMGQLFTNLISNAVAYTPSDRTPLVQVATVVRSDGWEITVRDNGVGIPAAWHDKVFGLFQRLPTGKALNPGGSGVGLAIVARVVETHGGRLWLDSMEGLGTTVHVALPKQPATTVPVWANGDGEAVSMLVGSGATG